MTFSMAVLLVSLAAGDGGAVPVSAPAHRVVIPPSDFTVFKEDSGPVNYSGCCQT